MPARILVVDDEDTLRLTLKTRLVAGGFSVTTASNGEEALDILKEKEFDVVLLDINMPQMDGITTLSIITERYPKLDVIMLTGFADFTVALECLKTGARDYLVKPIDHTELITRLKSFLRFRESQETLERLYNSHTTVMVDELLGSLAYCNRLISNLLHGELGPLTSDQSAFLTYISVLNHRTLQQIKQTLDIERLKSLHAAPESGTIYIEQVADEAARRTSLMAKSRGVEFTHTIETPLPVLNGDSLKISIALETVLMHAVNSSEDGGIVALWVNNDKKDPKILQMTVTVTQSKEQTAEVVQMLSHPFSDLSEKMVSMSTALLGLTLAKRYFELHNGTLTAEQGEGRGITFVCKMPVEAEH